MRPVRQRIDFQIQKRTALGYVRRGEDTLITDDVLADLAMKHRRRLLAQRIRRVARVMVVAAKADMTSGVLLKKKRLTTLRNSFGLLKKHSLRLSVVGLLCVFTVTSIFLPILQANNEDVFKLDAATKSLVGNTRDDAAQYLSYDKKTKAYTFAAPSQDTSDGYEHTGRNADAYDVTLPKNASEGVTLTENSSKIQVTLSPKFFTTPAQKSDENNLVYTSGKRKLIYTLKYNGLKEDIILPEYQGDTQQFTFRLSLPAGVEARMDESGGIGIYSADAALFGDISFGSDDDRSRVEKARENAEKTRLVMTIPFPVIKDANGIEYTDRSSFEVEDHQVERRSVSDESLPPNAPASLQTFNTYNLVVSANKLKNLSYPISIDPTVQVASASDFSKVNFEGGASLDTSNNLIKRSSLTGGTLNSWATNSVSLPTTGYGPVLSTYNGRVYSVHGTSIQSAPINTTDGSIGAFTSAGQASPYNVSYNNALIYNGYVYVGNSTNLAYAKIKTDGTLSPFVTTSVFLNARSSYNLAAINGYLYKSGGTTQTGCPVLCVDAYHSDIEYAKINGDGTTSAWASAGSNFTNGRVLHRVVSYNGYLYLLGGWDESNSFTNVQYASIKSDGSLNSWQTTTTITGGTRTAAGIQILNGYMYLVAGSDSLSSSVYAPIYADGALGTWRTSTSINNGRGGIGSFTYNNYIYIAGGAGNSGVNQYADIQYASIKPAGEATLYSASGDFDTTGRTYPASTAYNGYLYISGGSTDATGVSFSNVTRRAQINTDGTLGTWNTTSNAFAKARFKHSLAIYNGYIYIYGGYGACGLLGAVDYCNDVQYASINSNGDLGTWTTDSNNMLVARSAFAGVTYNGYLYAIAGRTSTGLQDDVDYAQIASDGSVGVWQNNPTSLSRVQELHAATAYGGHIYLTGGINAASLYRDVQYATITSSNGQVGSWTMFDPGDVGPWGSDKFGHATWAYNGYLYQAGGCGAIDGSGNCVNGTNDIQYRKINSDGTLVTGLWTPGSAAISGDFEVGLATAQYNGTVYFLAGLAGTVVHKDVNRITVNNGGAGTTSSWSTNSNSLITAREFFSTAVYDGYVYTFGGSTVVGCPAACAFQGSTAVEYAQINNDGSIGTFSTATSLPTARYNHASGIYGEYVYLVEGNTTDTSKVRYARMLSGGGLAADSGCGGTWCGTGQSSQRRQFAGATVSGQYMYIGGGSDNGGTILGTVEYARMLSTGGLAANAGCGSTWCSTSSFTKARQYLGMASNNGYVYVTGGYTTTSPNSVGGAEFAKVNANGSLGTFSSTTDPLLNVRGHSAEVLDGYLYLTVGQYGTPGDGLSGPQNIIYFAPILPDGRLGSWSKASNFTQASAFHSSFIYRAKLYILGGSNAGPLSSRLFYSRVEYTSIQSIQRLAQLSKLYDFNSGVKPTKLITRGNKQSSSTTKVSYSSVNNEMSTLNNNQTVTDIGYGGTNDLTLSLGTGRTLSRYIFLTYTIDDSQSGVFPDADNESTITDWDLYFTANPGDRLKGGRTFTEGADRGLDAAPQ